MDDEHDADINLRGFQKFLLPEFLSNVHTDWKFYSTVSCHFR